MCGPQTGQVKEYTRFADFVSDTPPDGLGTDLPTLKRFCKAFETDDGRIAFDLIDQASKHQGQRTDLADNFFVIYKKLSRMQQGLLVLQRCDA